MKRLISLMTALIMLLSIVQISAFADVFTLRNGILFGDSYDTIVEKETLDFSATDNISNDGSRQVVTEKGKVAGIDNCEITFSFTPEDKLYEMMYSYRSITSKDEIENDYKTIRDGLVRKYGTPLHNTNGDISILTTNAIDSAITNITMNKLFDIAADYMDYDEWIIDTDDGGSVKIDIIDLYTGSLNNRTYHLYVGYRYFSTDEMEQIIADKKAERDAIDNDL